MTAIQENATSLAHLFSATIRSWLTPAELAHVVAANAAETDPRICHSHDVCDANQAMIECLERMSVEYDPQDELQARLIDAAWDVAKAAGFAC